MKRSIVILLTLLAVATVFVTISCKSMVTLTRGTIAPPAESGHYLYDGDKWNKIPVNNLITGGGQINLDRFNQGTTFIIHAGQSIKYAYRMTPTEMQSAGGLLSNVSEITVSHIGISPLRDTQDKMALEFISSEQVHGNDKSDYTAGYVLLEYETLPASPIGKYWLHILVAPGYGIGIIVQ